VGLGHIGDIKFWAPNRGLLITAGNGSTIPPGVWAYDGVGWHELSDKCGGTDGRIVWEGPETFWTISDGRPGQAAIEGREPPLEDNTLCHFEPGPSAEGRVAVSYASPAFQANSYQAMHAGACFRPGDCWFAGEKLPAPQIGAFALHWNGSSLTAQAYPREGYTVQDAIPFGGHLFLAARLLQQTEEAPLSLLQVNASGVSPTFEQPPGLPLYGAEEFPTALDFLHLSVGDGALWGAASPVRETPLGSEQAYVTVVRDDPVEGWRQLVGPETAPSGREAFGGEVVNGIAAEPGTGAAWLAVDSAVDAEQPSPTALARVQRIHADGSIPTEDTQQLPAGEAVGPKGAAAKIVCPAAHDCWMATTQGWLFHLTTGTEKLEQDADPAFRGLITFRPLDEGVAQVAPDAPPPDESGLLGEAAREPPKLEVIKPPELRVTLPLVSQVRSRLVHGTTLELSFRLAVRARLRLVAKRKGRIVAATRMRTFAAGRGRLRLTLDPRRWPTKLQLQTHALAPLPTVSANSSNPSTGSVSTGVTVVPHVSGPLGPFR
jgi:hypothetical protein